MKQKILWALVSLAISSVGCQPSTQNQSLSGNLPAGSQLTICSALNFSQVQWSSSVPIAQQESLELAMNISGSFEGSSGWVNLTNNFDGQGMSMGLLNQNLGQGSLQPMLIEMRDNYPATLQGLFSSDHLQSLLTMLSQWQSDSAQIRALSFAEKRLSPLDKSENDLETDSTAVTANSKSVQWAVSNLYSGSSFVPQWKAELTALGNSAGFVSIQVEAATSIHKNALKDMTAFQVNEIRAYLMAFDIEVQNGGIYTKDFSDYATWVQANPGASTTAKLTEMLTLRLRHVLSQYVADVQSRKMAIINGSGIVHGANRNLEQEFCFNRLSPYQ